MTVDTGAAFPNISVALLDTRFLKGPGNRNYVGDAYAFSTTNPLNTRRFDPEGARVMPDGDFVALGRFEYSDMS